MTEAEKLLPGESLRQGFPKLNMMIDMVNYFQKQIDQMVIEGDSSVEAAQARVDGDGTTYTTLKERLDTEHSEVSSLLAQTAIDIKHFGAVGDGLTDDTLAIQQAIDFGITTGRPIKGEAKTYLVSRITLKPNAYFFKGVTFRSNGADTGNVYVVDCQAGVNVDEINVSVPTGATNERIVRVSGDSHVCRVKVVADSQHAVLNDLLDCCLMITGSNIKIDSVYIKNFDFAVNVYDSINVQVDEIICETFRRGVYVRKSKDCAFKNIFTKGKSPNALQEPGHNSLLIEECESLEFPFLHLSDAGEHAVRIGGVRDGVYLQKRFTFGIVITKRSGQCGFKAFTGDGNFIQYLYIDSLTTVDCAYLNTPGTNEDGLFLSGVQFGNIGTFTCVKELNGVSAYRGMYISNVEIVTIDSVTIWDTYNTGLTISVLDGRVNNLYINSLNIRRIKNEGVLIDHATDTLRDIILKNIYIREHGANYYGVKLNVGAVSQPVLIDGYVAKGASLGSFNSNLTNSNIYNKLVELV